MLIVLGPPYKHISILNQYSNDIKDRNFYDVSNMFIWNIKIANGGKGLHIPVTGSGSDIWFVVLDPKMYGNDVDNTDLVHEWGEDPRKWQGKLRLLTWKDILKINPHYF